MDGVGTKEETIFWKSMLRRGYINEEIIGHGKTSVVRKAWSSKLNKKVAVKVVDKTKAKPLYYEDKLSKEIETWFQLKHPNIVLLLDCVRDSRWTYVCMEYASEGDLELYLTNTFFIEKAFQKNIIFQIASGLYFLKTIGMCHGDVKPKNILIFGNTLKLCDFGTLKRYKKDSTETASGTLGYVAPEVLKGRPYDGEKADVWSFGVTSYRILTVGTKALSPIHTNIFSLSKNWTYFVPEKSRSLIKNSLKKIPSHRRTFDEIIDNEWLNEKDEEEEEED